MVGIVDDYVSKYREGAARELRFFAIQGSLADAVRHASFAEGPQGKRLSHQRRIPRNVLARVSTILGSALSDLESSKTFEDLHEKVEALIRHIPGVGELMVYDTSLRIGANLGLSPKEVFLHAGTRNGARALGLDTKRVSIPPDELPIELRDLKPREIEDLLCIYKDQLQEISHVH